MTARLTELLGQLDHLAASGPLAWRYTVNRLDDRDERWELTLRAPANVDYDLDDVAMTTNVTYRLYHHDLTVVVRRAVNHLNHLNHQRASSGRRCQQARR